MLDLSVVDQIYGLYWWGSRVVRLLVMRYICLIEICVCSEREFHRGDEIAWYADGDKIVRNEYNPATAYAFGIVSRTS